MHRDFSERECVVYGKGDKERKAYFDAKADSDEIKGFYR